MNRTRRIAILAAAVLLLIAAGSVMAGRAPVAPKEPAGLASSHEPEAETEDEAEVPPTAEDLARVGARLTKSGIPFEEAALSDLATRYGMGSAVRLLAWSEQAQTDVDALIAMREGSETDPAMGWGQMAKELGLHPGLGSIMGNGHGKGHGRENAPGQQKVPEE